MRLYYKISMVLCLSAMGLSAQSLDCSSVREGRFMVEPDSISPGSIIIRKGNRQVEYEIGSDKRLEFEVEWLDSCTYTLKLDTIINFEKDDRLPMDYVLRVEILETGDYGYLQRSTIDAYDISFIFRIRTLKPREYKAYK